MWTNVTWKIYYDITTSLQADGNLNLGMYGTNTQYYIAKTYTYRRQCIEALLMYCATVAQYTIFCIDDLHHSLLQGSVELI